MMNVVRLLFGFCVTFWAIIAFEFLGRDEWAIFSSPGIGRMVVELLIAPILVIAGLVGMVHQIRPLRMFQPKATGTFGPMRFGFLLGLVVAVLIPFALVGLIRWVDEAFIPALVTAVVSIPAFTLVARRCMPGYCARCGYDIRCSLEANRCPECGAVPMGSY